MATVKIINNETEKGCMMLRRKVQQDGTMAINKLRQCFIPNNKMRILNTMEACKRRKRKREAEKKQNNN